MGNRLDVKNQQATKLNPKHGTDPQQQTADAEGVCHDPLFGSSEGLPPQMDTDAASIVSGRSLFTVAPSIASIATYHSHRTRKRRNHRNKRTMEKRHENEEFELRMQSYDIYDRPFDENGPKRHRAPSPERSVMGPLDQDEVSMDDAASQAAMSPIRKKIPDFSALKQNPNNDMTNSDMFMNDGGGFFDELLELVAWDFESKRIIRLAIPFATQAASTGILDSITVAVIGKVRIRSCLMYHV
jgi:hypothetical protein